MLAGLWAANMNSALELKKMRVGMVALVAILLLIIILVFLVFIIKNKIRQYQNWVKLVEVFNS